MEVLIAEDHADMLELYARVTRADGHDVTTCQDGAAVLAALSRRRFGLLILDLRMPIISGFEVCRRMRAAGDHTPVLALTGLRTEEAELEALDAGADDYVVKPCSIDKLRARTRALLRRASLRSSTRWRLGKWEIDLETGVASALDPQVILHPAPVLTPLELRLLRFFSDRAGTIIPREELIAACWRGERTTSDNALAAVSMRLRRKLRGAGVTLRAVRNRGLMLSIHATTPTTRRPPARREPLVRRPVA
jgi:DNA-binding response OmpR family regulator